MTIAVRARVARGVLRPPVIGYAELGKGEPNCLRERPTLILVNIREPEMSFFSVGDEAVQRSAAQNRMRDAPKGHFTDTAVAIAT